MRRFVVTGTGHCGTGYTASMFKRMGINCGHERVLTFNKGEWGDYDGDSSALALPYMKKYDSEILFHQVRNPWRFLRSQMTSRGLFSNAYGEFLLRHCPEAAEYQDGPDPTLGWSAMFWIEWNRMAEGMADLTYRIEDLCPDLVRIMLEKFGEFRSLREIDGAM